VLGALADEVVDSIKRRSLADVAQAINGWALEEVADQRIPTEGAGLVQVAEQMFRGHVKGGVQIRAKQSDRPLAPKSSNWHSQELCFHDFHRRA
jgi:hypothetical protein